MTALLSHDLYLKPDSDGGSPVARIRTDSVQTHRPDNNPTTSTSRPRQGTRTASPADLRLTDRRFLVAGRAEELLDLFEKALLMTVDL